MDLAVFMSLPIRPYVEMTIYMYIARWAKLLKELRSFSLPRLAQPQIRTYCVPQITHVTFMLAMSPPVWLAIFQHSEAGSCSLAQGSSAVVMHIADQPQLSRASPPTFSMMAQPVWEAF